MSLLKNLNIGNRLVDEASLDLSFTAGEFRVNGVAKAMADIVTFTRASIGTRFNQDGLLEQVAVDVPRLDYDPLTLKPRGLLIEASRTNLAINSEQIVASVGTTATANATVAPDGAMSADLLVETATAGIEHYAGDRVIAVTSGQTYVWSVFVKDGPSANRRLFLRVAGGVLSMVIFDPRAKSISDTVNGGFEELKNGWFRVWLRVAATTTGSAVFRLQLGTQGSGATTYDGDGSSGLYLWGAHAEARQILSSYIPTGATEVTRADDLASVGNIAPWYNPAEGTLLAEGVTGDTTSGRTLATLSELSSSANHFAVRRAGGSSDATIQTNGVVISDFVGFAVDSSKTIKAATAAKLNSFAFSVNKEGLQAVSAGAMPTNISTLYLGRLVSTTYPLNGHLRTVKYIPRRLSNSELQALTA